MLDPNKDLISGGKIKTRIDCIETYQCDDAGVKTLYIPRIWSDYYQCMVELNRAYKTKWEAFQAAREFIE